MLVCADKGIGDFEKETIKKLSDLKIPFIIVFNKSDIYSTSSNDEEFCQAQKIPFVKTSVNDDTSVLVLKNLIIEQIPQDDMTLFSGMVNQNDLIVMVTPIDEEAPKGRLILPQVQAIRDVLDKKAMVMLTQTEQLPNTLASLKRLPDWVVTDSQAVKQVKEIIPSEVKLTTFSILFARLKGDLQVLKKGAEVLDILQDGDRILIAEACAHHMTGDDIAKVKIPNAIKKYTQKQVEFDFYNGSDFPDNLEEYKLVIHCGACMLNRAEMLNRLNECVRRNVPICNFGVILSKISTVETADLP